jgi:MFS family permease
MNIRNPIVGIIASCILCSGLTGYSLLLRYKAESLNKAVSLVAEADQIEALGAAEGLDFEEALAIMSKRGLNGVVISEETIGQLLSNGEVHFEYGRVKDNRQGVAIDGPLELLDNISRGLRNRFDLKANQISLTYIGENSPTMKLKVFGLSSNLLRSVSVGLNHEYVAGAKKHEIDIVCRFANPEGIADRGVRHTLMWARDDGARYFLPVGDQLLGRRDSVKAFAYALTEFQMIYASPEFAKIGGDPSMLASIPERSIRLHAAQTNEVDKLTQAGYIERYVKAASERGVRMLLLRPLTNASSKPLTSFAELTAAVANQVKQEGSSVLPAHPSEDSKVPKWLFAAIGLSIAPMALFAFASVVSSRWAQVLIGLIAMLIGAGCWIEAARPFAALLGSLAFPTGGFVLMEKMPRNGIIRYFGLAAISLLGGMSVAGLLNGLPYFLRADQFSGVKLAVFLPIAVVGWLYFVKLSDSKTALGSPVRWTQALIGIGFLVVLGFMMTRTGNDNPAGVSGFELQLRSLLENLLVVRPRTKEFLIGYPALVVGIAMLGRCQASDEFKQKWGGWTALALMVGALGITSMVNTLCHLHTPLIIGFVRIGFGLAIGGIIGIALWFALCRVFPELKKEKA